MLNQPDPETLQFYRQQTRYVLCCATWALSHAQFQAKDLSVIQGIIDHAERFLIQPQIELPKTAINTLIKRTKAEFRQDKDPAVARRAYAAYAAYSLIRLLGSREPSMRERHVAVAYSSCQEIAKNENLELNALEDQLRGFNLDEA